MANTFLVEIGVWLIMGTLLYVGTLCKVTPKQYNLALVNNDIYTQEDTHFLLCYLQLTLLMKPLKNNPDKVCMG